MRRGHLPAVHGEDKFPINTPRGRQPRPGTAASYSLPIPDAGFRIPDDADPILDKGQRARRPAGGVLHAARLCVRGGWLAASALRIPTRRETAGKNVKDNGMCRVAHAWLRGMRPRNGTSVSHGVCHETRGLIARNRLSRRACIAELRAPLSRPPSSFAARLPREIAECFLEASSRGPGN
jgi:hypothetical protein